MVTTSALRELHRIHRQLSDLRERLEKGPRQVKARLGRVTQLETALAEIKARVKEAKMTADRKNVELKSSEAKIRDLEAKLNAANSNKEFQAFKDQIAAAKMAGSVLSDEILEEFEEIDKIEAEAVEAQQKIGVAKEDAAKLEKQVASTIDGIQADVARLEAELKKAESELPDDFKADYERAVRGRGEDALASVEGEVCGGCFQQLRANNMNDLYMGRSVFCGSCGRFLYLAEDRELKRGKE
jgi:predicted  nucleic acid-binding Zn-ribbon protein